MLSWFDMIMNDGLGLEKGSAVTDFVTVLFRHGRGGGGGGQ